MRFGKKRGFSARRKTKRTKKLNSVATKGYVKRQLKKQIEPKHAEAATAPAGFGLSAPATIFRVNVPLQGTGDQARIGDRVNPYSLEIGYKIDQQNLASDTYNVCRVIVFQWLDDDTNYIPQDSDILLYSYSITPNNIFRQSISPYNWDQRKRFVVLHDQVHTVYDDTSGVAPMSVQVHKSVKLHRPIYLNNTSQDGTNNIYVMALSDSAPLTVHPLFYGLFMLKYRDA